MLRKPHWPISIESSVSCSWLNSLSLKWDSPLAYKYHVSCSVPSKLYAPCSLYWQSQRCVPLTRNRSEQSRDPNPNTILILVHAQSLPSLIGPRPLPALLIGPRPSSPPLHPQGWLGAVRRARAALFMSQGRTPYPRGSRVITSLAGNWDVHIVSYSPSCAWSTQWFKRRMQLFWWGNFNLFATVSRWVNLIIMLDLFGHMHLLSSKWNHWIALLRRLIDFPLGIELFLATHLTTITTFPANYTISARLQ